LHRRHLELMPKSMTTMADTPSMSGGETGEEDLGEDPPRNFEPHGDVANKLTPAIDPVSRS
jgi:hypothetical protein